MRSVEKSPPTSGYERASGEEKPEIITPVVGSTTRNLVNTPVPSTTGTESRSTRTVAAGMTRIDWIVWIDRFSIEAEISI